MVIIDYFRACLFDWRKKRAIKQARKSAELYRKKFLVLVHNGRPVCVSMQGIRKLIKQHRFAPGFTAEKACQIAIYEARPSNTSANVSHR